MVQVLILEGKDEHKADYIKIKSFDTLQLAKLYISEFNDLNTKYWCYCQLLEDDTSYETYNPSIL